MPPDLAMMGSIIALSFMFGPGMGAGLSRFSLQTPMFVSAGLAAIGWLSAFFAFEEPVRINEVDATPSKDNEVELETIEIEMTATAAGGTALEDGVNGSALDASHNIDDFHEAEADTDGEGDKKSSDVKEEKEATGGGDAIAANAVPARSSTAKLEAEKEAQAALAQIKEAQAKRAAEREAVRTERHRPVIYIIWCCSFLNYIGVSWTVVTVTGRREGQGMGWEGEHT